MTKHTQIKLLTRLIVICLFSVIFSVVYTRFLYPKDLEKYSSLIFDQQKFDSISRILYYGESSNFNCNPRDVEKRRISSFAADYYPSLPFNAIDNSALHAGNYKIYIRHIPEDSPVETIIVTMNLRSFNASWRYSELETALQKRMVLIDLRFPPLINRIRFSFKDYNIKSKEEWNQQVQDAWRNETLRFPFPFKYDNVDDWDWGMGHGYWRKDSTVLSSAEVELGCHYIKTYAFQIDTLSNPRIQDFDEIVKVAHQRGWNLVFNLMAENVERAQELVGDELCWLIRQNRDLLVGRYQKNGIIVVDNLEDVPDAEYTDRNWTTEHYAENGRKIIARNLADSLRRFYPSHYIEIKSP